MRRDHAAGAGCAILLALAALTPPGALAGSQDSPAAGGTTLTGDWDGARTRYADAGVTFRGDYVSETFANVSGGRQRGSTYAQQLRLGADVDMDRVAGWSGATLHVTVNDRRGAGVSADYIGNRLPVQEVYGGPYTRLTEASYEQSLADGRLDVRLGFLRWAMTLGEWHWAASW